MKGNAFPAATEALACAVTAIASGGTITTAGAVASISAISLSTGQIWVPVISAALVALIHTIKAQKVKFKKTKKNEGGKEDDT